MIPRSVFKLISIPGQIPPGIAYLDLETRKTPTDNYIMDNGEPLRRRWQAFAAGVASGEQISIIASEWEEHLLTLIAQEIEDNTIKYAATRQFDEMIMKGRFTNARRAHETAPFFPVMPGAEQREWVNIYKIVTGTEVTGRVADIPSRLVPKAWDDGRRAVVLVHLLRDVCELILAETRDYHLIEWCLKILGDTRYAEEVLAE
jgi:hypothetical protein